MLRTGLDRRRNKCGGIFRDREAGGNRETKRGGRLGKRQRDAGAGAWGRVLRPGSGSEISAVYAARLGHCSSLGLSFV